MKIKKVEIMRGKHCRKLRTRVAIAFIAIILVPIILAAVTISVFATLRLRSVRAEYEVENPSRESLYNNSLMISLESEEAFEAIQEILSKDPVLMEDKSFLEDLNKQSGEKSSYIIVRKGQSIYYLGSREVSEDGLAEILPEYGAAYSDRIDAAYVRIGGRCLLRQADFTFSDGDEGSVFLISGLERLSSGVRRWLAEMVLIMVVILTMIAVVMGIWIYRGVVIPLNRLRKATKNIKEGNLDFTVEGSKIEEINDLCEDFEEMRIRLKESAEEKVESDRGSKELISNISHDLKTPITAVKGYVEGIMDGVADTPEKMDRYIRTIYNKANEMDRLINELTFYSKIDTNRIPYTFTKIHVGDYFDDCVEDLSVELSAQHVELEYYNYLENDEVVIADAEQLKRVINNIVSNSVKYMDKPHKIINIRLRDEGDFIGMEIEDNGKGIAQKDVAKIFDRFYRTDASRNSTRGGSGIGLSIVRKIIEDHGGQVWATSKEGVGTVMHVVLRKYQEVPVS